MREETEEERVMKREEERGVGDMKADNLMTTLMI